MSAVTPHPTHEKLSAYNLGQLFPDEAESIEKHIGFCDPCCETIISLSSDDTFVALLKEAREAIINESLTLDASEQSFAAPTATIPRPLVEHPRYELMCPIGKGGMGQVFKARHRMMERAVALKVINYQWTRNSEVIERFRREVKTAASLDHPNIVTSYDAEQADELHFLVMEYVDGVDLSEKVKHDGALPVTQACEYIRQAALGLQYAHERGMVHRDIKPHNLMVTGNEVIKILDFGLASLAPQATSSEPMLTTDDGNLTIAGAVMGTPDFISPEQTQDAHSVDGRSDIYSLGMTFYYLLAGQLPFPEGGPAEKILKHLNAQPTSLASIRDDVPEALIQILQKMIAKDPGERFQNPSEVVSALDALIPTGSITEATASNVPTSFLAKCRLNRKRSMTIAVCATLLIVALGYLVKGPHQNNLQMVTGSADAPYETSNTSPQSPESPTSQNESMPERLVQSEDIGSAITKINKGYGDTASRVTAAICRAAGIPAKEWNEFEENRQSSSESIQGTPLSLVLLSTLDRNNNPDDIETQLASGSVFNEPQLTPTELTGLMALSAGQGYYSMLQPQYITNLTFQATETGSENAKLRGWADFNGLGRYSGKLYFEADVDHNLNMSVDKLALPAHDISIEKNDSDLWLTSVLEQAPQNVLADAYDFSYVPADAFQVHGLSPARLANDERFKLLIEKLSGSFLPIAQALDPRVEQFLYVQLPADEENPEPSVWVLTIGEGTSLQFAQDTLASDDTFKKTDEETSLTWRDAKDQGIVSIPGSRAIQIIDEKTLLVGQPETLKEYLTLCQQPRDEEFLSVTNGLRKDEHQYFNLSKPIERKNIATLALVMPDSQMLSMVMQHLSIFSDSNYLRLTLSLAKEPKIELLSRINRSDKQEIVTSTMRRLPAALAKLVSTIPTSPEDLESGDWLNLPAAFKEDLVSALEDAEVSKPSNLDLLLTVPLVDIAPQLKPVIDGFANRIPDKQILFDASSKNNLRSIALAFLLFEEKHGFYPSMQTMVPGAKYPVSWRVAILPYLAGEELYQQYHFDEPWDSEHNKTLIKQMPFTYRHPSKTAHEGRTNYVIVAGPDTATGDGKGPVSAGDLVSGDGLDTTMLVAETIASIPWTAPEDPTYDPAQPLPTLGGIYSKGWQAVMADGSAHLIPANVSDKCLRAIFTRNGGEHVDLTRLTDCE